MQKSKSYIRPPSKTSLRKYEPDSIYTYLYVSHFPYFLKPSLDIRLWNLTPSYTDHPPDCELRSIKL